MKISKKSYLIGAGISILMVALVFFYMRYVSPTKIATLNFPDFTVEKFIRSNNNPFVAIKSVGLDEVDKIAKYDMVLVRVHGSSMDAKHLQAIENAIKAGVPVFSTESDNSKINTLKGNQLKYVSLLLENGSVKNYRSLFNYIRAKIDRKLISNKEYAEASIVPEDYYFHLGDDNFFATLEEFQKFYEKSGKYKVDAPRIVLLSGNINMQNSNEEHIAAIINSLEKKGLNVYPINSFGHKKLSMIEAVKPNLIINRPHGRLVMGAGESGTDLLRRLNVPILAPVTISDLYENWLADKQGMASGGMTSMSVVMPELDGAIVPFAIAAQFERKGMHIFDAIPGHTEKFCSMVKNFVNLQTKENKDKKIAIYYYKGIGKGALNAADIEGVQSLYNTLKMLSENGYKVDGLPSSAKALEQLIQKRGSLFGAYALGAYDAFIRNGNPELVEVAQFNQWAAEVLPEKLIEDMHKQYGKAPEKNIVVTRIQFGNVVILPQPLPVEGDDIEKIIHGVEGALTYSYVASYLWTRKGFGADALIHFGTHGNLEFIPGKQVALSDYDWSDALIGDMPHFYIYTINNIGEGIIAKRRSYATLISHLTAPFMQGGLYNDFKKIVTQLHKAQSMEKGAVRDEHIKSLSALCQKQNIFSALGIDSTKILGDKELEKIHHYVEEIDGAKVTDGLYTLGEPYSKENIVNTTRLMSLDNVRYSLAKIELAHGKIEASKLDKLAFISHRYTAMAERLIAKAMAGVSPEQLFATAVTSADRQLLSTYEQEEQKKNERKRGMKQGGGMMAKMAQAKPQTDASAKKENTKTELISALQNLKESIEMIPFVQKQLLESTTQEQQSLLNALNGGYIAPSSGGDPIVNPRAVPTGRNFYSINPETTPTAEAWKVGCRLADNLLEQELSANGEYPQKVSFTLWASDFISSEGATVAQILYLLGVEPLRDGFGNIRSLQLIPAKKLGRARIDVVVQTSGQLRDIAASRLELINRAVAMAAEDKSSDNNVRKGLQDAEKLLLEKGFSPADARKFSQERVFGNVNGSYGTGIMGLVEKGDSWDSPEQIASQYIKNMGGVVFEAALLNTSVVVQPRSSNTWGPLSLDHVYEFMGGMSAAVQQVTGNDPTAYFNDFRNTSRAKVQGLKEAIGLESSSTVFNPKYIAEKLKGEASSMNSFAETVRNTFGWNAMKPSVIDQHIWNQYHQVYVKDAYNLGIEKTFSEKNPYALQDLTAIMLESARKGMWKASASQLKEVAELHVKMLIQHEAGCSGFICDNQKLQEFISQNIDKTNVETYKASINAARQIHIKQDEIDKSVVLKKEARTKEEASHSVENKETKNYSLLYIVGAFMLAVIAWIIYRRIKR